MIQARAKNIRVLAVAPSSRGFGFAVMEGTDTLVDWGVKAVKGDKNARSLSNVANLIEQYDPRVLALEDCRATGVRRASRIQILVQEIAALAKEAGLTVKLFKRGQVRQGFVLDGGGTKHDIAQKLASLFPRELGSRLPQKRKPWMSEDYRMDIFDAVALAQHCLNRKRGTSSPE